MIDIQDKAIDLLSRFKETADNGDYKEISQNKTVTFALSMLQDSAGKNLTELTANAFAFGLFIANHLESIKEEEQVKRCINCNQLTSRGGSLGCKLKKCKYE